MPVGYDVSTTAWIFQSYATSRRRGDRLQAVTQLTGAVPPEQIPNLLAQMNVAVAPYPASPDFYFSPLRVVEYMAAGLPVVVSNIGQLQHLVVPNVTGMLCPPGDEEALVGALMKLWGDRLPLVAEQYPHWATRISDILTACHTLAAPPRHLLIPSSPHPLIPSSPHPLIPSSPHPTTIHRDFYADQLLVDGDRLWLVDLDLCCQGSPAVDVGNFIAPITEPSLREMGDAEALSDREMPLQAIYLGLTCQPT